MPDTPFILDVLNAVRAEADTEYQERIPVATQMTFSEIGQAFREYTAQYCEFANTLMYKIGLTLLRNTSFNNKLKRFKAGKILSQQDVEEIFLGMAGKASAYNPQGPNPLGRRANVVPQVAYHRMNRRDVYCVTIGDLDFLRAFTSPEAAENYLRKLLQGMYTRIEADEYFHMKNVLATYGHVPQYAKTTDTELMNGKVYYTRTGSSPNYVYTPVSPSALDEGELSNYYEDTAVGVSHGYCDYQVPVITNESSARQFVKTLRKASKDVQYLSTKHNMAGVEDSVNPEQLVLFINKDVSVEIDVEMLSRAFNPSKTDIPLSNIVELDSFGTLPNTAGLLVHEDFFRVYDTLNRMEPQRNSEGLFTNYFYHVHQILSASPFRTAIRFAITEPETTEPET